MEIVPRIVPISAFKDNYVWTLRNERYAAVVDPGEARPVLDYLAREKLELAAILATHHHPDHVGGIAELVRHYRVPVFGPKKEPIVRKVREESEKLALAWERKGENWAVSVPATPRQRSWVRLTLKPGRRSLRSELVMNCVVQPVRLGCLACSKS